MKSVTRFIFYLFFNCIFYFSSYATVYYVDPVNGKDINNGVSIESAFNSITKAISTFKAGDTTYLREGIYSLTTTISILSSMDGTSENQYNLFAFPGDARPVLDFSSMAVDGSNRGIYLRGDFWYVKGIDIKGAGDNGMNISGSNNIIENCAFSENKDTGLQLSGGASNNKIINCDSYFNSDPGEGNADGFAPKLDVGTGNYFYGCRAWQNSDDGWDGYMRVTVGADTCTTILENCWCFKNGYLENGQASSGNGNGYKMGGSDQKNLRHNFILKNCIAFDNRVKGFDQNSNIGSMILLNCTAYRNGSNYGMNNVLSSGDSMIIKNCISLASSVSILSTAIQEKNSWIAPLSVSNEDFINLDPATAYGQRKTDGSLPDIAFLHLAPTSNLIDKGIDVGIVFNGTAPDLGAFESAYELPVPVELVNFTAEFFQNEVTLKWRTAVEINNYGFEVERKNADFETENSIWQKVGFIKGNGSTSSPKDYWYFDKPLNGTKFIYRIKQIDFNNQYKYFPEVKVTVERPDKLLLSQNYPNPFNPATIIDYYIPKESFVQLRIYDLLGKEIFVLVNEKKKAGSYSIQFNATGLASGIYFYTLTSDGHSEVKKMHVLR